MRDFTKGHEGPLCPLFKVPEKIMENVGAFVPQELSILINPHKEAA